MDEKTKRPARDLSDLKARLGLAKGAAQGPDSGAGSPVHPPQSMHHPQSVGSSAVGQGAVGGSSPVARAGVPSPGFAGGVLPGAGIPGVPRPQPQADARRDPFAAAGAAITSSAAPAITDAGPPIAIPAQAKSKKSLYLVVGGVLVAGLAAGYLFGGISHARVLFNNTIRDAKRIGAEIEKLAKLDEKVVKVLVESRARHKGKVQFDAKLVDDLRQIQQTAPLANPQNAKRVQNALFRTNYAMMDDLLISRLFEYFDNVVRLLATVDQFVDQAESDKNEIVAYTQGGGDIAQRKYGVVVAEDKGTFYLGSLVEVGRPTCKDVRATEQGKCKLGEITGFEVRAGNQTRWQHRPGRPTRKTRLVDIVLPIIPNEAWQSVVSGRPGFLAYGQYVARYRALMRIAGLLNAQRKPLLQSLRKQANQEPLFVL